jgi:thioredoxin-like negative regulator of GroEL
MTGRDFVEITDANFDAEVICSYLPVVLWFTAQGCPPGATGEVVEQIAAEHPLEYRVVRVDVELAPDTADRYGVHLRAGLDDPVVVLLRDGVRHEYAGGPAKDAILAALALP